MDIFWWVNDWWAWTGWYITMGFFTLRRLVGLLAYDDKGEWAGFTGDDGGLAAAGSFFWPVSWVIGFCCWLAEIGHKKNWVQRLVAHRSRDQKRRGKEHQLAKDQAAVDKREHELGLVDCACGKGKATIPKYTRHYGNLQSIDKWWCEDCRDAYEDVSSRRVGRSYDDPY